MLVRPFISRQPLHAHPHARKWCLRCWQRGRAHYAEREKRVPVFDVVPERTARAAANKIRQPSAQQTKAGGQISRVYLI